MKASHAGAMAGGREEIAIVGMAGRFPGSESVGELWENLRAGIESIRILTPEELRAAGVSEEEIANPEYTPATSALADGDCFDAGFFGYTKRDAEVMDPQHRIFLECAWAALEDAGYDSEAYDGAVGVFGGVAPNTYLPKVLMTRPDIMDLAGDYSILIGNEREYAMTRVAYKLNLKGPAISIATACSTSGVAMHLAYQSVLSGETDMALVGGGRVRVPFNTGYRYEPDGILSPDGHCRPFDAEAAGTIRGSGMAIVVIKRLSDAMRDGDTIRALIKGTAINNDGAAKVGYTAPGVAGQEAAIAEALEMAEVDPNSITYVEAHGTGTFLGDPIEVEALTRAYRRYTERSQYCALGSVKSNIGHMDTGAGTVGIIKTALAMQNRQIPPTVNFTRPNPQIDFRNSPFFVNDSLREWSATDGPLRAGVSAFGLGGTNAHVIMEQAPDLDRSPTARPWHVIPISARTPEALERATANMAVHLASDAGDDLGDVAYTLQVGRRPLEHRRVLVAADRTDAAEALARVDLRRVTSRVVQAEQGSVVFMFPGGGVQHFGMGRKLYASEPVFREAFEQCTAHVKERLGIELRELLYEGETVETPLEQPTEALVALFAVEYALAKLWISLGVQPDMLIGHSMGEYTAACLAGVLTLDDALEFIIVRSELFEKLPAGSMLSVPMAENEVRSLIDDSLSIAVVNKPDQCIVAGESSAIDRFAAQLKDRGIDSRRLHIAVAAHSHLIDPILDEFRKFTQTIKFHPPEIPIVSNLSGHVATAEDVADSEYWVEHLRQSVRFVDGLAAAFKAGGKVLVEVGPGQTLSGFARQHFARPPGMIVEASLPHVREAVADDLFFLNSVGRLWASGVSVDLQRLYAGERRSRIPLPTYPFERTRYWIEPGAMTERGASMKRIPRASADIIETRTGRNDGLADVRHTDDRKTRILASIQSVLRELSGLDLHELDPQATFLELGFDSLFLTQANFHLRKEFGVPITFRQLFDEAPTIDSLAEYIGAELPADALPDSELPEVRPALVASSDHEPDAETWDPPRTARPGPTDREPQGFVEHVISEQLRIMERQLELLSDEEAQRGPEQARPAIEAAQSTRPATGHYLASTRDDVDPFRGSSHGLTERQQTSIDELVRRYNAGTSESKRLADLWRPRMADNRTIVGFDRRWKELVYQIVSDRSRGSRIWDVDGNEYIDIAMGFGTNLLGHSPDIVVAAVHEQLDRGFEVAVQNRLLGEVSNMICAATGNERLAYTYSGGEAVETAIRLARTVTGREKIAYFTEDIHGRSDVVLGRGIEVGGERRTMPLVAGIPQHVVDDAVVLEYGTERALEVIRSRASELALVLVEPVRTRNPDLQPVNFLRELRAIASERGFLLVFDEIVTGFRAHPGGVQALFDVRADITTYGKVLGGGLPIGVVAGASQYIDIVDGGSWTFGDNSFPEADITASGGTMIKHPLALAAARSVLAHLKERGPSLQAGLNSLTAAAVQAINDAYSRSGVPIHVEHFSSFFRPTFMEETRFAGLLQYYLREHGVHTNPPSSSFLSTAHTSEDIESVISAYTAAGIDMMQGGFLDRGGTYRSTAAGDSDKALTVRVEPSLESAKDGDSAPLTEGQQEIWLATRLGDDANCAYNLASTLDLNGSLDVEVLVDSVQALVRRHEALRTTIDPDDRRQRIAPALELDVPIIDVSAMDSIEQDERLTAIQSAAVDSPFDLETGPLARATVVRLGAERHVLLVTVHHIICDGWSSGILIGELAELYTAAKRQRSPNLEHPMQLREYAEWESEYQSSDAWKGDEAFWTALLETPYPVSDFPPDRRRLPTRAFRADREQLSIDPGLASRIRDVASAHGVTLFTALLAALECYLYRLTGESEIALGVYVAGQAQFAGRDLVGHCTNMLPLRRMVDGSGAFNQHVRSTHSAFLDAFDHQRFSYGSLVKRLESRRDPGRTPLVSVTFNMDSPSRVLDFDGAEGHPGSLGRHFENFDVFLNVIPSGESLVLECTYNVSLFDADSIRRRLEGYVTLLAAIASSDSQPVAALPVVSSADHEILTLWNKTSADYDASATLHGLFERRAEKDPDAIALVFRDRQVTYGELNGRANHLARTELAAVETGRLIGVFMDRSIEMVVAMYAILKAGAGYVPLDPEYPDERLRFMIEETAMPVILTQEHLKDSLPESQARTCVINANEVTVSVADPDVKVAPSDVAYVMYTSGSTGRPKGVVVSHRAIANQMIWAQEYFELETSDRVLQKTPLSFDVSTLEFFWPLMVGARLVIAEPGRHRDAAYLIRTIASNKITMAHFVPSMLRFFLEHPEVESCATLRSVICIGEALAPDLRDRFFELLDSRLFNLFGPTEAAVTATYWECRRGADSAIVPIGRPVANTQIYILDESLSPVPIGVVGEIHIGGVQVAMGYLDRPELTDDRFIPDPFAEAEAARMYRTGDLGRYLPDGNIEFLGRADYQVKIRGNRVELGEIDEILEVHPDVSQAVTIVTRSTTGDERLVAYLTPQNSKIDEGVVRDFLKSQLPRYMVPSRFVTLDKLPMTTNGKIDRNALPVIETPSAPQSSEPVPPRTPLESDIAAVWSEVLDVSGFGVEDDFFDLGGHSLDAMRVNARLSQDLRIDVTLGSFFEDPTVKGQALAITAEMAAQLGEVGELESILSDLTVGDVEPESSAE